MANDELNISRRYSQYFQNKAKFDSGENVNLNSGSEERLPRDKDIENYASTIVNSN